MAQSHEDTLDLDLRARLREIVEAAPATEAELRALTERGDEVARLLDAAVDDGEERLSRLTADPASALAEVAAELRRVEALRAERNEVRRLLDRLDQRARELRAEWLSARSS